MRTDKNYLGRIKESVDFVYAIVTENPNGYEGGFNTVGSAITQHVVNALVKRGVLIRNQVCKMNGRKGRLFHYTWASNMSPTKNLYKTIMTDIRAAKRDENLRRYRRRIEEKTDGNTEITVIAKDTKEANKLEEDVCEQVFHRRPEKKGEPLSMEKILALKQYSIEDLWDELKLRGCYIEDNRLVIIKKAYLDY